MSNNIISLAVYNGKLYGARQNDEKPTLLAISKPAIEYTPVRYSIFTKIALFFTGQSSKYKKLLLKKAEKFIEQSNNKLKYDIDLLNVKKFLEG